MITKFEIENFRCFEKMTMVDLARVNLIGGKNNSGKTALLEALYLNHAPTVESINFLRRFRGENLETVKELPERAWDNLFLDPQRGVRFGLSATLGDGSISTVHLKIDDNIKNDGFNKIDEGQNGSDQFLGPSAFESSAKNIEAILSVSQSAPKDTLLFSLKADASTGIEVSRKRKPTVIRQIVFIPAGLKSSGSDLARAFDKAELNNNIGPVLEVIRVIDTSVVEAKTFNIGQPTLYLKREGQRFLPISLFGEALNRVVDFTLRVVNGGNETLLIDEIENGIHYTNQRELWQMLFKLAVEFDTQIFATTHSWEMIQAFRDVGLEAGNDAVGAYFELAPNVRTGRITAIKHDLETLDYAVERGMRIRGEQRFNR